MKPYVPHFQLIQLNDIKDTWVDVLQAPVSLNPQSHLHQARKTISMWNIH